MTNLGVFGDTVQSCDLKTGPVAELNMERAMNKRLEGKRVLITQARDFMGPALCDVLVEHGAIVLADESPLSAPDAAERVVRAAGTVDILVANLAIPVLVAPAAEVGDDGWRATFAAIVDPLPRLARALLPAMIARRSGKFLVMSSATALRGQSLTSTYCSARGAQLAWAQSAGVELAQHNVQVNAIAFNFLEARFPTTTRRNDPTAPRFTGKAEARGAAVWAVVAARRGAQRFAAYLCSAAADCFVGQVSGCVWAAGCSAEARSSRVGVVARAFAIGCSSTPRTHCLRPENSTRDIILHSLDALMSRPGCTVLDDRFKALNPRGA